MDKTSVSDGTHKILLLGISGITCSGKTTLARLLRDIWPNTFILHEDDFYWPDSQIPVKNGVQDWDCLEAINLDALHKALLHIREHGTPPPDLESKEDQNASTDSGVSPAIVQNLKEEASRQLGKDHAVRIAIMDGFLLYSQEMKSIWELLDVRLFLRTRYETANKRREDRIGYVTIDGFWEDPPGYVEDIVWPNYAQEHKHLFKNQDINGELDPEVCKILGLHTMPPEAESDMTLCLGWANSIVQGAVASENSR